MEPEENDLVSDIQESQEDIQETAPEKTEQQIAFEELVNELSELNLEKDDIVFFRNGVIGKIDAISINNEELMYRIYVKVTEDIIFTLDENFKNTDNNRNYDVDKILGADFNIKLTVDLEDLVLTKEQAQQELTNLKGQTVVIE